jgi:hypothetical protein
MTRAGARARGSSPLHLPGRYATLHLRKRIGPPQSRRVNRAPHLLFVLVGALDPEKGLDINQVARTQIANEAPDLVRKGQ